MSCYYTGAGNNSMCYELYDKTRLAPDISVFANVAEEMVNSMGQKVNYWVNTTTPLSADVIYGEQPTSVYDGPHTLKMYINLNESSLSQSKFGFNAGDDATGYMAYNNFLRVMSGATIYTELNQSVEPKAGDVFEMHEYGSDRVNGRTGRFFQITQKRDQNVGEQMNILGGHYGWEVKAMRMEYSWEPGLPQEGVNEQMTSDTFYGKLTSTIAGEVSSAEKSYEGSVDEESKKFVFNMNVNDTDMYGTYDLSTSNNIIIPVAPSHTFDLPTTEIELTPETLGSIIDANIAEDIQRLEEFIDQENFIRYDIDAVDGGDF